MGGVTINSNIAALGAQRRLAESQDATTRSFERLSSGLRINRASDDAAGLSVSSALNANTRIAGQAIRNINDGVSYLNIADSTVSELSNVVTRLTELATQAANGSYSLTQRRATNVEADQLVKEFNRLVQSATFNGRALFEGGASFLALQAGRGEGSVLTQSVGGRLARAVGTGSHVTGAVTPVTAADTLSAGQMVDIDNDGDLDLLVLDTATDRLSIMQNDGNGGFVEREQLGVGDSTTFTVGDLNNDGLLDIVTNTSSNAIEVFFGGASSFGGATTFDPGIPGQVMAIGIVDLDGDGNVEVLTAHDSGSFAVQTGVGGTTTYDKIHLGQLLSGGISVPGGMRITDFNGDGRPDVLINDGTSLSIFNGNGTLGLSLSQTITPGGNLLDFDVGDLNRDGYQDVVLGTDINVQRFLGVSPGRVEGAASQTFDPGTLEGGVVTSASHVALRDLDNDGVLDYALGYRGGVLSLLLDEAGSIRASAASVPPSGPAVSFLATGDLNGDGVIDFISGDDLNFSVRLAQTAQSSTVALLNLTSADLARESLDILSAIRDRISLERGMIGAFQSRLQSTLSVLQAAKENFEAAEARIKVVDIASESASLVRSRILQQVGASVLAQANIQPQIALRLLGQ